MRERNADITLGVLVDPVEFKEIALNLQATEARSTTRRPNRATMGLGNHR
jgi:hypothetical protein